MGLLFVLDTVLVYKIVERRYSRNVAFVSAIFFAVMPFNWVLRRILLDGFSLPLILSSVLFAVYIRRGQNNNVGNRDNNSNSHRYILCGLSGIFLGLAIFTKIPMFVLIPLVGLVIYQNTRSLRSLAAWSVPVVLIPMLWPAQAILTGNFDNWLEGINAQTTREDRGIISFLQYFIDMDPVFFVLGMTGMGFAILRKDPFLLLWIVPYIFFIYFIGYHNYFYWILTLPAFAIGSGYLVINLLNMIKRIKIRNIAQISITFAVFLFGLISTIMIMTVDATSQYEALALTVNYIQTHYKVNNSNNTDGNNLARGAGVLENVTIISSPVYSWIIKYIFEFDNAYNNYRTILFNPIRTPNVVMMVDSHYNSTAKNIDQLKSLQDNSDSIFKFNSDYKNYDKGKFPYTNLKHIREGSLVDIRIAHDSERFKSLQKNTIAHPPTLSAETD